MVAEELNITRAAERLYISQQSLSNHISNMERELDVKLFTRSPKLALTYAGNLLVDTASQILELNSQYLAKVGDINRHYSGVCPPQKAAVFPPYRSTKKSCSIYNLSLRRRVIPAPAFYFKKFKIERFSD